MAQSRSDNKKRSMRRHPDDNARSWHTGGNLVQNETDLAEALVGVFECRRVPLTAKVFDHCRISSDGRSTHASAAQSADTKSLLARC